MAKAKFDIKTEYTRSLYAYVGVADLAVEAVRDYFAKAVDVQKEVATKVADLDYKPAALREQAVTVVNARVDALSAEAKARRAKIEARVAELQTQLQAEAKSLPAKLNDTYADLAERGERLVGRIRRQESTKATVKSAKTTVTKAKTTKTQATKAAESTVERHQDGCEAGDQVHEHRGEAEHLLRDQQRQGHRHRGQEDRGQRGGRCRRRRREDRRLITAVRSLIEPVVR